MIVLKHEITNEGNVLMKYKGLIAILPAFSLSTQLYGQDRHQEPERIEVVGSKIKRLDGESPQPIEVLSKEDIQKSGATELSQLIRDYSIVASFGGYKSQVNIGETQASGGNSADLRGLGSKNTLVLLNGHRLPADGVTGSVDLSIIPVSAIEKIEILKDGASAIYGSDAAGGVINITTKRDFEGFSVSTRYDSTKIKGGDVSTFSAAHGYVGDKFKSTTVASYRKAEAVSATDIDFLTKAASGYSFPSNVYTPSTGVVASPECPADQINSIGRCTYDYNQTTQVYPKTEQLSFLNTSSYEINEKLEAYTRILYSENKDKHNMAPNAAEFTVDAATAGAILNPAIPGYQTGEDATFMVRTVGLGNRVEHCTENLLTNLFNSVNDAPYFCIIFQG